MVTALKQATRPRRRSTCSGTAIRSNDQYWAKPNYHLTESSVSMMSRVSMLLLEVKSRRHRVMPRSNCNCRPSSNSLVRKYYAVVSLMLWTFLGGSNAFYLPTKAFYFDLHLRSANYAPSSYRFGTITTASQTVKCYSVSLRGSDANLDTLEKEILNEQSSQSKCNKSSRLSKKRSKSRRKNWERKPFSTNPSDAKSYTYSRRGGHSSHGKRGRRNRTALEDAQVMPPWLSRYENEDFATSTFYLGGASQSTSVRKPSEQDVSHVQRLHLALNGIFRQSSASENTSTSTTDMLPVTTPYFTKAEIHEIMDAIRVASHENTNLMAGCADFLYMMLTLEEEGVLNSSSESLIKEQWDDDDISSFGYLDWENGPERMDGGLPEPFSIMTRDVLVAAAFHYCDCVRARKAGVYDYARQAMEASLDMTAWKEREVEKRELLSLPPHVVDQPDRMDMDPERHKKHDIGVITTQATIPVMENEAAMIVGTKSIRNSPLDYYGDESVKIVADAARLKRAEIMATTVHSSGSLITKGAASKSKADAEILRSFLVSLSEDWRALVIRSAACLYRLKGITDELDDTNMSTRSALNRSTNTVARDAFKVYAPLAQRLGMQRLKSDLENRAFRILYPRQYSVASSLYRAGMDEMKSIVHALSSRIEQILKSDQVFVDQVESVSVSSRVKEPYSLWRKMIRYRKEAIISKDDRASSVGANRQFVPSLKWIPDVIALRVVLRARRLSSLEDEESLSTREKMLCYYALQIISDVWPASSRNEAKDYIKYPKPNGYQSLHYTATLTIAGEEWPFEVQIRSEEMHRVAEFGVAAHWDYKLQKKMIESLPGASLPGGISPVFPLLSESESEEQVVVNNPPRAMQKGRIASFIEALTASRETIVQNNLFVFLSSTERAIDGNIVSIDPSATQIADVLKKYGANIDDEMLDDISAGALTIYRNGVKTSMDEKLYNGDVLTLPISLLNNLSGRSWEEEVHR